MVQTHFANMGKSASGAKRAAETAVVVQPSDGSPGKIATSLAVVSPKRAKADKRMIFVFGETSPYNDRPDDKMLVAAARSDNMNNFAVLREKIVKETIWIPYGQNGRNPVNVDKQKAGEASDKAKGLDSSFRQSS